MIVNIGNFRYAVKFTLSKTVEGGFVDNPHDKGGPTNGGITQKTLSEWRGHAVTVDDVRALGMEEKLQIFQARYWAPNKSDELPLQIAVVLFDGAVNSGPGESAKWLQRALGVDDDGRIGPATIEAARKASGDKGIILSMIQKRREFDRELSDYAEFGHGWEARLDALTSYALSLQGGL